MAKQNMIAEKEIMKILARIENQGEAKNEGGMYSKAYLRGVNDGFRFCIEQIRQELE